MATLTWIAAKKPSKTGKTSFDKLDWPRICRLSADQRHG
jgi:hypothetical protein